MFSEVPKWLVYVCAVPLSPGTLWRCDRSVVGFVLAGKRWFECFSKESACTGSVTLFFFTFYSERLMVDAVPKVFTSGPHSDATPILLE